MLLISLMLAAAPAPVMTPRMVQRREAPRARRASAPARSKRLTELEATVRSLSYTGAEEEARGPRGM